MQTSKSKPSYLGLLNAISLAETEAGVKIASPEMDRALQASKAGAARKRSAR